MGTTNFKEIEDWCIKNDILIYAVEDSDDTVRIVIRYKDKPPKIGAKIYKAKDHQSGDERWWDVVKRLKLHYYKRLKK